MLFKLAINNVKKSIRDYAVYFMTLAFGVCIFYVFNSIESQQAMLVISDTKRDILKLLSQIIGYVSVFISVILGFLIIYANKFLIKRRKKELGVYMTLGMQKSRISKMLVTETLIIGLFSLIVGLAAGIFVSQGLSVFTAKLFAANMKAYTFIFSQEALIKSIVYFGLIFIIVIIFNTISISRYKLITLLNASKKNESLKVKKLWVSVMLFITSVICLGFAYYLIIDNGLMSLDYKFTMSLILGIIGTLLFFMSLSGFLIKVVKSNKKLYYKNLNMFVLRQLNSKINTTFVSMTIICLMLLITIGSLSTGASISNALTNDLKSFTPFDATIVEYAQEGKETISIVDSLKKSNLDIKNFAKDYVEVPSYITNATYNDIMKGDTGNVPLAIKESMSKISMPVLSLSGYNSIAKMQGIKPLTLGENEFVINADFAGMYDILNNFLSNKGKLTIDGQKLVAKQKDIVIATLITSQGKMNTGTLVVNDEILKNYKPKAVNLNINYKNIDDIERKQLEKKIGNSNFKEKDAGLILSSKAKVYDQSAGMTAIMTYLALYIGIVFLITSAAILALQQLSEASDNYERYNLLRKLGTEEKMIKKALFSQILIYFVMPLLLAIIHSVVGIKVVNNVVKSLGNLDILGSTITTAIIIIIVYGGYFLATYLSSKNIIRPKKS